MLPFKQKKMRGLLIREFSENIKSVDLVWHRDHSDREVKVRAGKGWRLQLENKLPISLKAGKTYFIPKNTYHRILKGERSLVVEIRETKSKKSAKLRKKRAINEIKTVPSRWWEYEPDEVMADIYHQRRQIPPTDPKEREIQWQSIKSQLEKRYPKK